MAIYHNNLKYHEDTITKHQITEDERQFLRDLQKELNTQDHVSQADPRFWVIKGNEKIYNVDVDVADGYELYNEDICDTVASTIEELKEYIEDELLDDINDTDGIKRTIEIDKNAYNKEVIIVSWYENEEDEDNSEICTLQLDDAHDVQEWLEDMGYSEYKVITYAIIDKIYPDTMFLTQKDAEEHLKANDYHYDENAHTYAMTAWRSPVVEKLIKILQEVEF